MRHRGDPIADDSRFLLATNSFRLAACGLFAPLVARGRIALRDERPTRAVLRRYLRQRRIVDLPICRPWQFRNLGATAMFETHPDARDHMTRLGHEERARMDYAGISDEGFARFRLAL
ncbi:hypothetical protein MLD63_05275 [Paracoccus sp. TK19116]|uniref:Uncharacterized protein n=1 Tax=Paracoccus albicereus TaxID=2922394 RepID=A0ABT1MNH5_9RHOB|nr:hypothetical protein [Paracoccus albicereus]